jgi:Pentapeptide repeats (8 copies)
LNVLKRSTRWVLTVLAAVVVALVIAWVLLVPGADWLAAHDVGQVTGALRTMRLETARDAARGRLLTLAAGVLATSALIFTARNFTLSRRTFELTEQGQVTDRYTKAIERLGSDKLDVRIGGVYALERVARDSPRDHSTVIDVLAAFIREHSHEQWPVAEPGAETPERTTRPDVQAAVTVVARRDPEHDRQAIDLNRADLTRANLSGATLSGADLSGANLSGAPLSSADLARANLRGADLTGAIVRDADLTGAVLGGADLSGATLSGADLSGANLGCADLARANLDGAIWSEAERAPDGWERDPASGRLRRAIEGTGDAGN